MYGKIEWTIETAMATPDWVWDVIEALEIEFDFELKGVHYKTPKNPENWAGAYFSMSKRLTLHLSPEKTGVNLFVVLHELSHALQHLVYPETLTKRKPGKNRVHHNQEFFKIAKRLYIRYGVLEIAAENEYKRARKLMKV